MKVGVVPALAALLLTSACVQHDVTFDPAHLAGIHVIALAGPINPASLSIQTKEAEDQQKNEMMVAGLLGTVAGFGTALTIQHDRAAMSRPLNDAASAAHFQMGDELRLKLADALKDEGYGVIISPIKDRALFGLAANYDGADPRADTILDVSLSMAGVTDTVLKSDPHFRPVADMYVRVLSRKSGATLMQREFFYGDGDLDSATAIRIDGDPQFDLKSFADIAPNAPHLVEGLRAGEAPIVMAIAATLKK